MPVINDGQHRKSTSENIECLSIGGLVMKRIVLFVLGVLAVSSSPSAQAPADAIATAMLALPASVREGATVIKWKPDQTYDTLQKGTNGLVCYDRSGFPLQQPFSVECTSMGN